MRVLFITYSLTGNTLFLAQSIGKVLKEQYGHTITYIDAAEIIKAAKLGRTKSSGSVENKLDCKELQDLRSQLAQTDVLGLGAFVSYSLPEFGLEAIFDQKILSSEFFSNIKYFFTYTTHGSYPHPVGDILATIINRRAPNATYFGHLNVRAPENFAPLQPPKSKHDAWDTKEIGKIDPYANQLGQSLQSPDGKKGVSFQRISNNNYGMQISAMSMTGHPKHDKSKCVKCGTCVKACPYDVIKFGNSGFPEWDINSCLGCTRCFNKCPNDAIDFPKVFGSYRSKYPSPDFTKVGVGNGKNEKGEIMQPLPQPSEIFARMRWKP
ncbi:MAG: ferredoxin 4Fe-4S [Streblomastix strix]|uniref:Ferredoxin 4Fe-4S n=1 Tax=Streblomastix strix TaxID=222440 RepID=A0A5J4VNU6_9EUKA|nr:MAG: ferredoxin 4Fe-4S [Streblomastix strix]